MRTLMENVRKTTSRLASEHVVLKNAFLSSWEDAPAFPRDRLHTHSRLWNSVTSRVNALVWRRDRYRRRHRLRTQSALVRIIGLVGVHPVLLERSLDSSRK